MSALSERIAKANRDNLSSRDVVKRAAGFGIRVSHGTVANILKGSHGTPEDNTLRALGRVFDIPFPEMRQLVGLGVTDEPWEPPEVAARMSPKQRRLVESLIHELVRPDEAISTVHPISQEEIAALLDERRTVRGTGKPVTPKRRRPSPRS